MAPSCPHCATTDPLNPYGDAVIWGTETTVYITTPISNSSEVLDDWTTELRLPPLLPPPPPPPPVKIRRIDNPELPRPNLDWRLQLKHAELQRRLSKRESYISMTTVASDLVTTHRETALTTPSSLYSTVDCSIKDLGPTSTKTSFDGDGKFLLPEVNFDRNEESSPAAFTHWALPAHVNSRLSDPSRLAPVNSSRTENRRSWRDHWSRISTNFRLWDGTIVDYDANTGLWSFKPTSIETIENLEAYRPLLASNGNETSPIQQAENKQDAPAPPAAPTHTRMSRTREYLFIFNVCLAQLFSLAALAQTVAPLFIIGGSLGITTPGRLAWPTAAYSLTVGTFILPAGRLGSLFGHKRTFVFGWIWFSLASLIVGFSYNSDEVMLAACRALQGIGPAILVPNGIALIGTNFPPGPKRALAISLFGGMGPTGFVLGAVFSSVFAQLVWWPWAFWVMSMACLFMATFSNLVIPTDNLQHNTYQSIESRLRQFDMLGAFTGVSGLVLINFAFNQAPIVGWASSQIIPTMVVGIFLMVAFVHVEMHVAENPIVPIKRLHRDAAFTLSCIAVGWGSHGIWCYYLFLLLENVRGHSALGACARIWPVAPIGFCAALSVGFLLKRMRVAYLMCIAMACFGLGCLLLATAPAHQVYWANIFLSVVITPFAMNFSFPAGTILMTNAVPREQQGIAASLVATAVNYSISTGLGVAGTVDRYVTRDHGVVAGYRGAWYFGIGLSVLGLVVSGYFVWETRLNKPSRGPA